MSELRRQMEKDMIVRGMAERTQQAYVGAVAGLAKFYRKSPEKIDDREAQAYLAAPARRAQARLQQLQYRVQRLALFLSDNARKGQE